MGSSKQLDDKCKSDSEFSDKVVLAVAVVPLLF